VNSEAEPAKELYRDLDSIEEMKEGNHVLARLTIGDSVLVRGWQAIAAQAHLSHVMVVALCVMGLVAGLQGMWLASAIASAAGYAELQAEDRPLLVLGAASVFSPMGSAWRDGLLAGQNGTAQLLASRSVSVSDGSNVTVLSYLSLSRKNTDATMALVFLVVGVTLLVFSLMCTCLQPAFPFMAESHAGGVRPET